MEDDYQFDDVDASTTPMSTGGGQSDHGYNKPQGRPNGNYASEIFSKQIKAKFRTFYIDLKQSSNGKFVAFSEKSHGRKSRIMMDAEDIPAFIEALKEVSTHL